MAVVGIAPSPSIDKGWEVDICSEKLANKLSKTLLTLACQLHIISHPVSPSHCQYKDSSGTLIGWHHEEGVMEDSGLGLLLKNGYRSQWEREETMAVGGTVGEMPVGCY